MVIKRGSGEANPPSSSGLHGHGWGILNPSSANCYLKENESEIYPRIGRLGAKVRKEIEEIFASLGFNVKCTGYGDSVTEHSSLVGVQFLKDEVDRISFPEQVWNPEVCDLELREKIFKLAMLEEGFNIFHGYGAVSTAHTESDIQASLDAVERIAKRWRDTR